MSKSALTSTADPVKRIERIEVALGEILIKTEADASLQYVREFQSIFVKLQIVKSYLTKKEKEKRQ